MLALGAVPGSASDNPVGCPLDAADFNEGEDTKGGDD